MTPKHSHDEQPRTTWPVNDQDRPGSGSVAARLHSRPGRARHAEAQKAAPARAAVATPAAPTPDRPAADRPAAVAAPDRPAPDRPAAERLPGDLDFSTYVQQSLERERPPQDPVAERARAAERASFERVGYGSLYQSEQAQGDGRLLGLDFATVAERRAVTDERWAGSLRSFARPAVWCLPAAAILLALTTVFGWPTASTEPTLVSPGTWVVLTGLGLGLWLVGVVALAALAAPHRVRGFGYFAVAASALGVGLLAPVVGAVGLARPVISRTANAIQDDPRIAGAAAQMQSGLLGGAVGPGLLVAASVLLLLGAIAVAATVLGSRVLTRHDGWLMIAAIIMAGIAALLSFQFLLTLAAMVMLAATLGLAYTVSRLAADGSPTWD